MLALSVATLLVASTLSTASPTPIARSKAIQRRSASVFSFQRKSVQGDNKVFNVEAARQERTRVQLKYSGATSKTSSSGAQKRALKTTSKPFDVKTKRDGDSGKESLTDSNQQNVDVLYFGTISVGTPPQDTTIDFDTGSSDLVIPLSICQGNCTAPLFDSSKSSTFKGTNTPFSIQYEDKSGANGTVATDTVTVAGLTAPQQGFGAIDTEFNGFGGPNAGLMGLGFPDNAESKSTPFFINLAKAGSLASNVFSFFMARGGADGSELCFGCIDSDKFTGDVDYYSLDPSATNNVQLYWNIPSTGLTYDGASQSGNSTDDGTQTGGSDDGSQTGGSDDGSDDGSQSGSSDDGTQTGDDNGSDDTGDDGGDDTGDDGDDDNGDDLSGGLKARATGGFSAVIDSGTSLIYVPTDVAKDLYSKIPGSAPAPQDVGDGFYTFPCNAAIGTVSFGFGSKQYAINPADFNMGAVSDGSSDCVGGVIGGDLGGNLAILGDEFMKNWYSVFDYDKLAVGFAKAN